MGRGLFEATKIKVGQSSCEGREGNSGGKGKRRVRPIRECRVGEIESWKNLPNAARVEGHKLSLTSRKRREISVKGRRVQLALCCRE